MTRSAPLVPDPVLDQEVQHLLAGYDGYDIPEADQALYAQFISVQDDAAMEALVNSLAPRYLSHGVDMLVYLAAKSNPVCRRWLYEWAAPCLGKLALHGAVNDNELNARLRAMIMAAHYGCGDAAFALGIVYEDVMHDTARAAYWYTRCALHAEKAYRDKGRQALEGMRHAHMD